MKKVKKPLLYVLLFIVTLIVAGVTYIKLALPNVGKPEDIHVTIDSQHVARGKYLAMHVTACMDCHSTRDWKHFAGPVDSNMIGGGGEKFDARAGFPGDMYSTNITPFNLSSWTDGEIFRAITSGVKKDGSAIFPLMPWQSYSKMDRQDIYDIIAYLRTIPSQNKTYAPTKLDFPLNLLVNTMPEKATLGKRPSESDTLKYGEYLVQIAACKDCHTPEVKGKLIEGMEYAGGRNFQMPKYTLHSSNISPDKENGIGSWTKEQFVERFKAYSPKTYQSPNVTPDDFQTVMPWTMYADMKTTDLEAMYKYLQTLTPKHNKVNKMEPRKAGA